MCYSLNSSGWWNCPWTDCRAWSGATTSDQAPKARDVPSREREYPQRSMRHYQVQLLWEIWKVRTPCGGFALEQRQLFRIWEDFPVKVFKDTIGAFPFLEEKKLKNELSIIYSTEDFRDAAGALVLYRLIISQQLECLSPK